MQSAIRLPSPPDGQLAISSRFGIPLPQLSQIEKGITDLENHRKDLVPPPPDSAPLPKTLVTQPLTSIKSFVPVRLRVRRWYSMMFRAKSTCGLIV